MPIGEAAVSEEAECRNDSGDQCNAQQVMPSDCGDGGRYANGECPGGDRHQNETAPGGEAQAGSERPA